jgi:protein subunit release factor B
MLFRMYARWAERHKYKVEVIEETPGDEAGLKSATMLVKGHNAFGWAKTESGVHHDIDWLELDNMGGRCLTRVIRFSRETCLTPH